jgi:hypothetical protein
MAVSIRVVDYFATTLANRPGTGAKALSVFRSARVPLRAVHAFPSGARTQMDLVPANAGKLKRAARAGRIRLGRPKKAFLIEGDDRTGVVAGVLGALGEAGINVTAVSAAVAGRGRFAAILWVKPRDVAAARRALGARAR